jgi:hypothetical protein
MNNSHDEIKKLLRASRNLLSNENTIVESWDIKKQYGIIKEQYDLTASNPTKKINVAKTIEKEIDADKNEPSRSFESLSAPPPSSKTASRRDKKVAFRISGGVLVLHGKDTKELSLTSDEKTAFQETMEEFVTEVSDLVEYNQLNVYPKSVEWSGKLIEFNVEFMYMVGEENGVYMRGDMITMNDDFMDVVQQLKGYYEKFKSKWSRILANRKMTKLSNDEEVEGI